jgi:hypothetical protein
MLGVKGGASVAFVNKTVITSPTLSPTSRGGGFDASTDRIPGQQSVAPAPLPSPAAHRVHADAVLAPAMLLYRPGPHGTQDVFAVAPIVSR